RETSRNAARLEHLPRLGRTDHRNGSLLLGILNFSAVFPGSVILTPLTGIRSVNQI
ncbi:hypothetical protein AVEN_2046-1, partial [Araneus ventricosus]